VESVHRRQQRRFQCNDAAPLVVAATRNVAAKHSTGMEWGPTTMTRHFMPHELHKFHHR
jgi:hypothetical protein